MSRAAHNYKRMLKLRQKHGQRTSKLEAAMVRKRIAAEPQPQGKVASSSSSSAMDSWEDGKDTRHERRGGLGCFICPGSLLDRMGRAQALCLTRSRMRADRNRLGDLAFVPEVADREDDSGRAAAPLDHRARRKEIRAAVLTRRRLQEAAAEAAGEADMGLLPFVSDERFAALCRTVTALPELLAACRLATTTDSLSEVLECAWEAARAVRDEALSAGDEAASSETGTLQLGQLSNVDCLLFVAVAAGSGAVATVRIVDSAGEEIALLEGGEQGEEMDE